MLRTIWRSIELLLMLLGLVAVAVIAMRVQDDAMRGIVEPPWSVQTVDEFRKWRPHYDKAFRAEAGESAYYLVHGERGRLLASGPSGYVFDERGNFVGWIRDTGDDTYLRIVMGKEGSRTALPTNKISPVKGPR